MPFNNSFRPGKKPFDFYMAQVSYLPSARRTSSFSNSYYFVNQAVVANAGTPISRVKTVAGLRPYKLGATGRDDELRLHHRLHQAFAEVRASTTRTTTRSPALNAGQIDGIVVDLPTAFYVVAVQLDDGTIVGKLPSVARASTSAWCFEKGSPLVTCVNRALNRLWANGTMKALQRKYLAKAGAPDLR